VKTPKPSTQTLTLPEPIRAAPEVAGVQYGGMDDTVSGNDEATVTKDTTPTEVVPTTAPTYQQNTTVTTEETAPTKASKIKRKPQGAI
ncbi:DUF5476 domain-containing protein, partial [Herbiconiux daphne]